MAGECALRSEDSEHLCGGWEDRMVRGRLRTGARCRRKDLLSAYCGQPDRRSCRGNGKGSRWKPMDFFGLRTAWNDRCGCCTASGLIFEKAQRCQSTAAGCFTAIRPGECGWDMRTEKWSCMKMAASTFIRRKTG